jgi:hypothetical protein
VAGALVLLFTTGGLLITGGLAAASLRFRPLPDYLLAVYVIACAEIVSLVAVLSLASSVRRWSLILGVAVLLIAAAVGWALAGRPAAPPVQPTLRTLLSLLRDPPLAILAVTVALAFGYLLALALFTAPNSIDALWYHLPRAAMWLQQHRVGYIPNVNDTRLNGNPPVAEIGMLFTMAVSGTDRYVTLVSLSAYCMLPVSVYGVTRRLGVDARAALFAGLVFATLPVLLLEASSAKNDLMLGVFAVICTYFCLGTRRAEAVLAALALALALGTKIFAPLFLPIIALVVVVGVARRRAFLLAALAVPAILAGAAWDVVNVAQTGSAVGQLGSEGAGGASSVAHFVPTTVRYLIDFAEAPGAAGWWLIAYVASAAVTVALLVRTRRVRGAAVAAALVAALPFVAILFANAAQRIYRYVLFHTGHPGLGVLDADRSPYAADLMTSYYGPLGIALLLTLFALLARRRRAQPVALVFAAAPLVLVLEISLGVGYTNTSGRFYVFAMALAVAAFATFLSSRPLLWAVVAVAVPTAVLTLRANNEKPPSIWGEPRWRVQTHVGPNNGETRLIEYAAQSLPTDTRVGLALNVADISYPFFDTHLQRRVRFVSSTRAGVAGLDWLVVAPRRHAPRGAWRVVVQTPGGWRLYQRA